MTFKTTYALAVLASSLIAGTAHAEGHTSDTPSEEVQAAIPSESPADVSASPSATAKQTESTLLQTLESMPDWSKDLASRIRLHGYAQAGYTYQGKGAEDNTNTFDLKRILFFADAQITDRWSLFFMYDFKGSITHEFYTDYRLTDNKALTVRLGQFKTAITYENELSPTAVEAIDVLAEGVAYLAGAGSDPLYGVQYGRDLGLAIFGETNNGRLSYKINVLNGQGINKKDGNREKDFIGRVDWKPTPSLTLIASGQLGRGHAIAPSLYVPEIQAGENYKRDRWTAGFVYNTKGIKLHGEYLEGRDKDATSRGAYVTGCVPLNKSLDFVGSYDFFNYNVDRHMDQHKGMAGIQYWFYKKCRLQLLYVYKNSYIQNGAFHHGANHAIMGQVQVRFN